MNLLVGEFVIFRSTWALDGFNHVLMTGFCAGIEAQSQGSKNGTQCWYKIERTKTFYSSINFGYFEYYNQTEREWTEHQIYFEWKTIILAPEKEKF